MKLALEHNINRFLFRPTCPIRIAQFRLLLASFLAYVYWPRGLNSIHVPDILLPLGDIYLTPLWRMAMFAAIILFGLGWQPRLVGAVLVCLIAPHCFLESGRQSRLAIVFVTFCAALLPGKPVWRWREGIDETLPTGPIWPIRLIQCQLSVLYGINALVKTTPEYLSGDVLKALSARPNFLVDLTDGALALGPFSIPVAVLATSTVAVEYWLAMGLWFPRCRRFTACLGLGFHIVLMFVIDIFMLGYLSVFLYSAFLIPFETSNRLPSKTAAV